HTCDHTANKTASTFTLNENKQSNIQLGKVILGFYQFCENLSVTARSPESCPIYGNRHTPYYMGLITQMLGRDFLLCRGCVYNYISSHAHDIQTRNNSLWITQRVACENRTSYMLHDSQSPATNSIVQYILEHYDKLHINKHSY
ncbi:hypothetical protein SFRURICE_018342, partial [Spodoptera frugiperda]